MTIAEVKAQIEEIKKTKDKPDVEQAHGMEDELFKNVLQAIAKGSKSARSLAREALKSLEIEMSRHCA